jgi:hypothetical protein
MILLVKNDRNTQQFVNMRSQTYLSISHSEIYSLQLSQHLH